MILDIPKPIFFFTFYLVIQCVADHSFGPDNEVGIFIQLRRDSTHSKTNYFLVDQVHIQMFYILDQFLVCTSSYVARQLLALFLLVLIQSFLGI